MISCVSHLVHIRHIHIALSGLFIYTYLKPQVQFHHVSWRIVPYTLGYSLLSAVALCFCCFNVICFYLLLLTKRHA